MKKVVVYLCALQLMVLFGTNAQTDEFFGSSIAAAGFVLCAAWLLLKSALPGIRKLNLFHVLVFLFFSWSASTFFWSEDAASSMRNSLSYLRYFIIMYIFWDVLDSRDDLIVCMKGIVIGSGIALLSQFASYFAGITFRAARYSAADFDPNYFAVLLAIAIPLAWYLSLICARRVELTIYMLFIPIAILGGVLTGSRTAFVLIPIGLLYPLWTILNGTARSLLMNQTGICLLAVMTIVGVIVISQVDFSGPLGRISTLWDGSYNADTLGARTPFWEKGLKRLNENMFMGLGTGSYALTTDKWHIAHNTYISVLVETGIIGFTFFMSAIVSVVWNIFMVESCSQLRACWVFVLLTLLAGIFTLTWEVRPYMWLILSLPVISSKSLQYQKASEIWE